MDKIIYQSDRSNQWYDKDDIDTMIKKKKRNSWYNLNWIKYNYVLGG